MILDREQIISFLLKEGLSQEEALWTFQIIQKHLISFLQNNQKSTKNFHREPRSKGKIFRVRITKKIRICLILVENKLQIFEYDPQHKTSNCTDLLK